MGLLDGKVAVITGAGSGMAKASVKVFVREGASVVAGDISGAENDTAAEVGEGVVPVHCDVTNEADVEAMMRAAVERVRPARRRAQRGGHRRRGDAHRCHDGALRPHDEHRSARRAPRHEARDPRDGRRRQRRRDRQLVVDRRPQCRRSRPSVYSAAKAGVISLTKSAAVEYARKGIRVNCDLPRIHQDRDHGRGARALPRRRRAHAAQASRPAARDRRGRSVPGVRPRVVRHRRDHPGRRRSLRTHRVTRSPLRRRARRTRRGRPAAHRSQRIRRRHRVAGDAARVSSCAARTRAPRFTGSTRGPRSPRRACGSCSPRRISTSTRKSSGTRRWARRAPRLPDRRSPTTEVRFVGDPVALVVAESLAARRRRGGARRHRLRGARAGRRLHHRRARRRARARAPRLQRDR